MEPGEAFPLGRPQGEDDSALSAQTIVRVFPPPERESSELSTDGREDVQIGTPRRTFHLGLGLHFWEGEDSSRSEMRLGSSLPPWEGMLRQVLF
jgi:hypothetical protein